MISPEAIEKIGFVKINNSMWRMDNMTLQCAWTNDGGTLVEKILSQRQAHKLSVNGRFHSIIEEEWKLKAIIYMIENPVQS